MYYISRHYIVYHKFIVLFVNYELHDLSIMMEKRNIKGIKIYKIIHLVLKKAVKRN